MSSWFTLHGDDVGMTSSCSHCVHIMLMMSSHSDHDVIVKHVNHDCSLACDRQTLHMTGRPLCITCRSWQITGRPMCDLEACDMSNQWKYVILMWFDLELHHKT